MRLHKEDSIEKATNVPKVTRPGRPPGAAAPHAFGLAARPLRTRAQLALCGPVFLAPVPGGDRVPQSVTSEALPRGASPRSPASCPGEGRPLFPCAPRAGPTPWPRAQHAPRRALAGLRGAVAKMPRVRPGPRQNYDDTGAPQGRGGVRTFPGKQPPLVSIKSI